MSSSSSSSSLNEKETSELWSSQLIRNPSDQETGKYAQALGFELSASEVSDLSAVVSSLMPSFDVVSRLAVELSPKSSSTSSVNLYPRQVLSADAGVRSDENELNAWACRLLVEGNESGVLSGYDVVLKDNVALAGAPMRNGSSLMRGYVCDVDATVVTRILEAGGNVVGKSVCENLCLSGSSFTSASGPVLNPHDRTRAAGGSSSGSAALVAAGHVHLAIAGDQGGSIRIPSSFCGTVGLKPTRGLVPYTGIVAIEPSVDYVGPIARDVRGCALLLQAIAGFDASDPLGRDARQLAGTPARGSADYVAAAAAAQTAIRIGVLREGFGTEHAERIVDTSVRGALERAAAVPNGHVELVDVSLPAHKHGVAVWNAIGIDGGTTVLLERGGASLGVVGYIHTSAVDALTDGLRTRPNELSATAKVFGVAAAHIRAHSVGAHHYAVGQNVGAQLSACYTALMREHRLDALAMPTTPQRATKLPTAEQGKSIATQASFALNMIANTAVFDVTGHPALSMPVPPMATDQDIDAHLPIGLQLVARHFDEARLLGVAQHLELLFGKL
jgi:amidase